MVTDDGQSRDIHGAKVQDPGFGGGVIGVMNADETTATSTWAMGISWTRMSWRVFHW